MQRDVKRTWITHRFFQPSLSITVSASRSPPYYAIPSPIPNITEDTEVFNTRIILNCLLSRGELFHGLVVKYLAWFVCKMGVKRPVRISPPRVFDRKSLAVAVSCRDRREREKTEQGFRNSVSIAGRVVRQSACVLTLIPLLFPVLFSWSP